MIAAAGLVILADVPLIATQFLGACQGLMSLLYWLPVLGLWGVGVLLPAAWRAVTARLGATATKALVWSTALTATPPLLAWVVNSAHMGHCIG